MFVTWITLLYETFCSEIPRCCWVTFLFFNTVQRILFINTNACLQWKQILQVLYLHHGTGILKSVHAKISRHILPNLKDLAECMLYIHIFNTKELYKTYVLCVCVFLYIWVCTQARSRVKIRMIKNTQKILGIQFGYGFSYNSR